MTRTSCQSVASFTLSILFLSIAFGLFFSSIFFSWTITLATLNPYSRLLQVEDKKVNRAQYFYKLFLCFKERTLKRLQNVVSIIFLHTRKSLFRNLSVFLDQTLLLDFCSLKAPFLRRKCGLFTVFCCLSVALLPGCPNADISLQRFVVYARHGSAVIPLWEDFQ